MKIIGNRNGSWLVEDGIDETADEYSCTLDHENVDVEGDHDGECTVKIDTDEGPMVGNFSDGELIGKWEYAD